jgi:hypothetical protein
MATIYNIILVTNGPNFLDVLLIQWIGESLLCIYLQIENLTSTDIASNVDKNI